MRIIIAIDIIGGKCVRLTKGDYQTVKVYNEDPLEVARQIEENGLGFLHLVDLDGARTKQIVNHKILEKITGKTSLKVDFGGGIRSGKDLKTAFECGAVQVTCGSTAIYDPENFMKWLSFYGPDKIILGADSINRKVSASGWMENSEQDVVKFISNYAGKGVSYTICTDIEKDGMLQGPSVLLYKEILAAANINLIASGGVTTLKDIEDLKEAGCEGAIIGKAVYEGKLTLKKLATLC
jgi:phosphoribosylformimino-5-aminoimidazole carboxamide ribotide isomerase